MPTSTWLLVAVLAAATAFGVWRRAQDGRVRAVAAATAGRLSAADVGAPLGDQATLLQVSSAFCAPCRTARVVLTEVAGRVAGVAHVEVDAEQNLDLVRRLGVLRTPTTLVLDAEGREVLRAAGVPRREAVLSALDGVVR